MNRRPPRKCVVRHGSRLNEFTLDELLRALHGIDIAVEDCLTYPDRDSFLLSNQKNLDFFLGRKAFVLAELERRR